MCLAVVLVAAMLEVGGGERDNNIVGIGIIIVAIAG
jgi:hypothetical protein